MPDNIIGQIILEGASTVEDVVVTSSSSKRVIAEGTLQDGDVENRNHRLYATKDLDSEIKGSRMKELLETGNMKGELGHPLSDSIVRQQTVDPKNCCVRYTKIWMEKNLVKGQFKGTNNAYGDEFDQDLREGVKPSFSLRALGSIENVNGKAYVRGLKIITYDVVVFPSHRVAYTDKIVSESTMDDTYMRMSYEDRMRRIQEMNEFGRIINFSGNDAKDLLNKLQRESAGLDAIVNTFEGIADKVAVREGKLVLNTRFGETMYLNLNEHVENVIMNFACGY